MRGIWEYIKEHLTVFIGASAGLTVGILMLVIGFWPTLLLSITTTLGAVFIGMPKARENVRAWTIAIFRKFIKGHSD